MYKTSPGTVRSGDAASPKVRAFSGAEGCAQGPQDVPYDKAAAAK